MIPLATVISQNSHQLLVLSNCTHQTLLNQWAPLTLWSQWNHLHYWTNCWGYPDRWQPLTVKNIATEIQVPKSTEIQSIYEVFQVSTHVQWPTPTEIFRLVQLFSDWTCNFSHSSLNLMHNVFTSALKFTDSCGNRIPWKLWPNCSDLLTFGKAIFLLVVYCAETVKSILHIAICEAGGGVVVGCKVLNQCWACLVWCFHVCAEWIPWHFPPFTPFPIHSFPSFLLGLWLVLKCGCCQMNSE